MEHHPDVVMLLCFFVAIKTSELRVSLRKLCQAAIAVEALSLKRYNHSQLCERLRHLEPDFAQVLKFHFIVYLPFRPLRGFLAAFETKKSLPRISSGEQKRIQSVLNDYTSSDLVLQYPPSQIALAAVQAVLGVAVVKAFLLDSSTEEAASQALIDRLGRIADSAAGKQEDIEDGEVHDKAPSSSLAKTHYSTLSIRE